MLNRKFSVRNYTANYLLWYTYEADPFDFADAFGTHAFRLYDLELGARISSGATAIIADIDVASFEKLSLAVDDQAEPQLPEVLHSLGMSPIVRSTQESRHAGA